MKKTDNLVGNKIELFVERKLSGNGGQKEVNRFGITARVRIEHDKF